MGDNLGNSFGEQFEVEFVDNFGDVVKGRVGGVRAEAILGTIVGDTWRPFLGIHLNEDRANKKNKSNSETTKQMLSISIATSRAAPQSL